MKKTNGPAELQVGRVYNRVYVDDNAAYARINGKETFKVLKISPALEVIELFDQFGDPLTPEIRSKSTTTFSKPVEGFKEFEIFEPADESEWFKKSVKFTSLAPALEQRLITLEDVRAMANWHGRSPFMVSLDETWKAVAAVQASFWVEDKTEHPLLQTVFIVWKDWPSLTADFASLGIKAKT